MCLSVCLSTLLNINISETSGPIATKFYLKHHWGGGKAALAGIIFWGDLERFAHFLGKNLIEICQIGGKISYKKVNFANDFAEISQKNLNFSPVYAECAIFSHDFLSKN